MNISLTIPGFEDRLEIRFFGKQHDLRTDADLMSVLDDESIVSLKQVHGNKVITAHEPSKRLMEADAVTTDAADLWLTIRAADCQQIVIYAPDKDVIGAAHAGWKGLKAGVIPALLQHMKAAWGIDTSKAHVLAGPSLCTDCAEFTDPITELTGLDPNFFDGRNADLRGIADAQLVEAGIPKENIIRSADCTKCMNETYWSYRGGDEEKVGGGWGNVMAVKLTMNN